MKHKLLLTIIICIFSFSFVNAQDPWIIQVYKELYSRQPSAWELNIKNYNLGTWNNYGELKSYIQEYQNSLINNGYDFKVTNLKNGEAAAILNLNGTPVAAALISNTTGSLIGNDSAGLIGLDGATLIGLDGATLQNLSSISFADQGTKFILSSRLKVLKTSGRGRIVLRKK